MLNHGPGDHPGHSSPRRDDAESAASAEEHATTTEERGSFALARCSCGWLGPARRARSRALQDALAHVQT